MARFLSNKEIAAAKASKGYRDSSGNLISSSSRSSGSSGGGSSSSSSNTQKPTQPAPMTPPKESKQVEIPVYESRGARLVRVGTQTVNRESVPIKQAVKKQTASNENMSRYETGVTSFTKAAEEVKKEKAIDKLVKFGEGMQSTERGSYIVPKKDIVKDSIALQEIKRKAAENKPKVDYQVSKNSPYKSEIAPAKKDRLRPLKEFYSGLKSGFFFEKDAAQNVRATGIKNAEDVGVILGSVGGLVSLGKSETVLKGAKAAQVAAKGTKAGKIAVKTSQYIAKKPVLKFYTDIASNAIAGVTIVKTAEKASELAAEPEIKRAIKSKGFNEALGAGFAKESEALSKESMVKSLAFEINPALSDKKRVFVNEVRQQFIKQGLSGRQLQSAVEAAQRQRTAASVGEAASLLFISARSEQIGRAGVSKALAKLGTKGPIPKQKIGFELFKTTFSAIAKPGFIEGASQEIVQQQSRKDLRPVIAKESFQNLQSFGNELINPKSKISNVVTMGTFGAISAGVIGGTIAATRPQKEIISKGIEWTANIMDPFEKPGDLFADFVGKQVKQTGRVPVITTTLSATDVFNIGTKSKTPTKTTTKTQAKTIAPVNLPTLEDIIQPKKPNKSFIPSTSISPLVDTPVNIPIDIPVNIPSNVPTQTSTTTNTNLFQNTFTQLPMPTNTNIPINLPIVTPIARLPPPLLLPGMDLSGSGGGGGKRKRKGQFIDELRISQKLFNRLLFG